jgi:t-SNARE complex subunit (syntaxin)
LSHFGLNRGYNTVHYSSVFNKQNFGNNKILLSARKADLKKGFHNLVVVVLVIVVLVFVVGTRVKKGF